MSAVSDLTPQMQGYVGEFMDPDNLGWLPYVMYFHPANFKTDIVSTDGSGFRYTEARNKRHSATTLDRSEPVRLLVGSSTVFGTGATADRHTLSSRLTENDPRPEPWVNFGGRAFNSMQELFQFLLYRHQLPPIKEVVIFSGLNDLVLSGLPSHLRGEHGGFFFSQQFFDRLTGKKPSGLTTWFKKEVKEAKPDDILPVDAQIAYTADLILRHVDSWRMLCDAIGARLSYVLQPLANWVRPRGSVEEQAIFAELDTQGSFRETYRDVCSVTTHQAFLERLQPGMTEMGVNFVDFTSVLAKAARPDQWLFVDRIHFTDEGSDVVAKLLLRELNNGDQS
ncbi:hypothetical protein WJ95_03595 [Burkholderia ubonensis]|uniref:SGNH hydrolase-type esterase domain-containing protein n=2 Tax=Burkholderia cepacia complex TaxID=87882 RepID=A0A102QTW6_9BURK|nr:MULTISPECIES: hypothetical protein [Burkholderia cepacia complex]AJX12147.1 putative iopA [Burkholderia ubonensis MSMB22]AOK19391.1 hypothetical protein WT26_26135 [Burkholderia cepacia]AOK26151.1 hypothetical protein WK67_25995 [Burkholderia ubonensis]KVA73229.1 hypothetical protein WM36_22700 [Burkholderia ubonensis]KVC84824.1 hypothetical protein WI76_07000 [Burkholderia ubonensis]